MTSLEAIVVMDTDEFIVPCPYCDESHTHKESCRLSQTNTGNVYVIVAKRTGIKQPDHLRQGASS